MRFLLPVLLRLILWVGLPLLLLVLVIGPKRIGRAVRFGWNWMFRKRLDPEEILNQVVREHEAHVTALRSALAQAEVAESEIDRNLKQSEKSVEQLERESSQLVSKGDELGARAALYKLNLERMALDNFRDQLRRQHELIEESRRRLYLLELQLRQYEVGKSILLSQLAQAEKVEQQYAIASQFDPFNAVANWQKAEGLVQEKAINARAIERVYVDTAEISTSQPVPIDPELLDAQLAELRAKAQHIVENHQPEVESPRKRKLKGKQD